MSKQIPIVDYLVIDDGEPYLRAHECTNCGALFFGRHNACARCAQRTFTPRKLATGGVLRSFAIVHKAAAGVPVPYVSGVVDLDGGGDVKSNVLNVGADPENLELGMRVQLVTYTAAQDTEGSEAIAFGFQPA